MKIISKYLNRKYFIAFALAFFTVNNVFSMNQALSTLTQKAIPHIGAIASVLTKKLVAMVLIGDKEGIKETLGDITKQNGKIQTEVKNYFASHSERVMHETLDTYNLERVTRKDDAETKDHNLKQNSYSQSKEQTNFFENNVSLNRQKSGILAPPPGPFNEDRYHPSLAQNNQLSFQATFAEKHSQNHSSNFPLNASITGSTLYGAAFILGFVAIKDYIIPYLFNKKQKESLASTQKKDAVDYRENVNIREHDTFENNEFYREAEKMSLNIIRNSILQLCSPQSSVSEQMATLVYLNKTNMLNKKGKYINHFLDKVNKRIFDSNGDLKAKVEDNHIKELSSLEWQKKAAVYLDHIMPDSSTIDVAINDYGYSQELKNISKKALRKEFPLDLHRDALQRKDIIADNPYNINIAQLAEAESAINFKSQDGITAFKNVIKQNKVDVNDNDHYKRTKKNILHALYKKHLLHGGVPKLYQHDPLAQEINRKSLWKRPDEYCNYIQKLYQRYTIKSKWQNYLNLESKPLDATTESFLYALTDDIKLTDNKSALTKAMLDQLEAYSKTLDIHKQKKLYESVCTKNGILKKFEAQAQLYSNIPNCDFLNENHRKSLYAINMFLSQHEGTEKQAEIEKGINYALAALHKTELFNGYMKLAQEQFSNLTQRKGLLTDCNDFSQGYKSRHDEKLFIETLHKALALKATKNINNYQALLNNATANFGIKGINIAHSLYKNNREDSLQIVHNIREALEAKSSTIATYNMLAQLLKEVKTCPQIPKGDSILGLVLRKPIEMFKEDALQKSYSSAKHFKEQTRNNSKPLFHESIITKQQLDHYLDLATEILEKAKSKRTALDNAAALYADTLRRALITAVDCKNVQESNQILSLVQGIAERCEEYKEELIKRDSCNPHKETEKELFCNPGKAQEEIKFCADIPASQEKENICNPGSKEKESEIKTCNAEIQTLPSIDIPIAQELDQEKQPVQTSQIEQESESKPQVEEQAKAQTRTNDTSSKFIEARFKELEQWLQERGLTIEHDPAISVEEFTTLISKLLLSGIPFDKLLNLVEDTKICNKIINKDNIALVKEKPGVIAESSIYKANILHELHGKFKLNRKDGKVSSIKGFHHDPDGEIKKLGDQGIGKIRIEQLGEKAQGCYRAKIYIDDNKVEKDMFPEEMSIVEITKIINEALHNIDHDLTYISERAYHLLGKSKNGLVIHFVANKLDQTKNLLEIRTFYPDIQYMKDVMLKGKNE